jgi:hypothetical protein
MLSSVDVLAAKGSEGRAAHSLLLTSAPWQTLALFGFA